MHQLLDARATGKAEGDGAGRYQRATEMLAQRGPGVGAEGGLTADAAFEVLRQTAQSTGAWQTVLSMVYVAGEHAVYYCLGGNFTAIEKHVFPPGAG